eukprot:2543348-Amphidinium_carterae.1
MDDPATQALFSANELDTVDAHMVFNLISRQTEEDGKDTDQPGIGLLDFVRGCAKLKGSAKSAQIMCLMQETEALRKDVLESIGKLQTSLSARPRAARPKVAGPPTVAPTSEAL